VAPSLATSSSSNVCSSGSSSSSSSSSTSSLLTPSNAYFNYQANQFNTSSSFNPSSNPNSSLSNTSNHYNYNTAAAAAAAGYCNPVNSAINSNENDSYLNSQLQYSNGAWYSNPNDPRFASKNFTILQVFSFLNNNLIKKLF
jgi:hypothetical protein